MTRDKNSIAAQRMREYRKRKKEKLIKETMSNLKISKKEAEEKVIKNIRKDNTEQRAHNRSKIKSKQLNNNTNKDNVKVVSNEKVEEEDFILKLKVKKLVILDDDKDMWNKLTNVEKILIDRMNLKQDKNNYAKVRTLIQYLNKVKSLYKKLNTEFKGTNIHILTQTDTIIKLLENYKGKKDYFAAIIAVLKAYRHRNKFVDFYRKEMMKSKDEVILQQKNNEKTQSQKHNWIKYNTILHLFKKNKHILNDKDKLLLTLIICYPRRLQDYQKMRLHKKGKKDHNYNYLNLNKDKQPTTFDFFRSKSQDYEVIGANQTIPNSVKTTITEYLTNNTIVNNQLLFSNNDGTMYSTDAFSKKIRKLFFLITGKDINMNLYRHIVATDLTNKKVSINKRELIANQMGHSYTTNLLYSKHKK